MAAAPVSGVFVALPAPIGRSWGLGTGTFTSTIFGVAQSESSTSRIAGVRRESGMTTTDGGSVVSHPATSEIKDKAHTSNGF
jgi:hypothetical protein